MGDADSSVDVLIRVSSDAAGAAPATAAINDAAAATTKGGGAAQEAGKQAEKSGFSYRALHKALGLVGMGSKELEVGLTMLSGVMMGSVMFGIFAVTEALKLLTEHLKKQKEQALETAKATLTFWEASLAKSADARQAARDYTEALEGIAKGVDDLKEKESRYEAVLKEVLKQRLEILAASEQADLAAAKGDKEEEARIKARYGMRKAEIELENQALEIAEKRKQLAEQTAVAEQKAKALKAAEGAKEAGPEGRAESMLAEKWLQSHGEDLAKAQAARMKPEDLSALRAEVDQRRGESSYMANPSGGTSITAAGSARAQLEKADKAEQEFLGLQQEWEQMQGDLARFEEGTEKLAKAVTAGTEDLKKATDAAEATRKGLAIDESVHSVDVDASRSKNSERRRGELQGAGFKNTPLGQNLMGDVEAMEGVSQGQRMSKAQTEGVNHLVAGLRAMGNNQESINALLVEMKNLHIDHAQKIKDIMAALKQVQGGSTRTLP